MSILFVVAWALILGGFGLIRFVRPKKRGRGKLVIGILLMLLGTFIWMMYMAGAGFSDDRIMAYLGYQAAGLVVAFVATGLVRKRPGRAAPGSPGRAGYTAATAVAFYNACGENGISDIDSAVNRQRALLLLQSRHPDMPQPENVLEAMFEAGRAAVAEAAETRKNAERAGRLTALRREQETHLARQNRIAALRGGEKRIFMLGEQLAEAQAKLKVHTDAQMAAANLSVAMTQASSERETGWGALSGLATGIAGSAAGAAVAVDIMAKDQEVRQRNEQRQQHYSEMFADSINKAGHDAGAVRKVIKEIQAEIEGTKIKLTDESRSQDALMSVLTVQTAPRMRRTETGAIEVGVEVAASTSLPIEELKKTAIDGTLKATILADGRAVAQADLPLPAYGLSYNQSAQLKGLCIPGGLPENADLKVELKPGYLWVIEV